MTRGEDAAAWIALPVGSIIVGPRLWPVDPAHVANLKVAISETRWHGAILVRPLVDGDELGPRYQLVAGAHRLQAMKELGRPTIPCMIRPLSDDEALQIEIDENLVRRGVTPLERCEMISRRFEVWARRFPDRVVTDAEQAAPKRGRPSNSAKFAEFQNGVPDTMGFTAETAADVGLSKRTVEAAWTTVRGLPQGLRDQLRGSWIAKNEGVLRQLAGLSTPEEKAAVIDVLLGGQTKNVSDARALAAGNTPSRPAQTPVDETLKAFRKVWGAASPSARAAILHDLAGRSLPKGWVVKAEEPRDGK